MIRVRAHVAFTVANTACIPGLVFELPEEVVPDLVERRFASLVEPEIAPVSDAAPPVDPTEKDPAETEEDPMQPEEPAAVPDDQLVTPEVPAEPVAEAAPAQPNVTKSAPPRRR